MDCLGGISDEYKRKETEIMQGRDDDFGVKTGFGKKILLYDHDRSFVSVLQKVLSRSGYRGFIAHDLPEAKEFLSQNEFDLVLISLNSSHDEFQQTLAHIRDLARDTNIIVTTKFEEEQLRQNLISSGVKRVLSKPMRKNDLLRAISSVLHESRSEKHPEGYFLG